MRLIGRVFNYYCKYMTQTCRNKDGFLTKAELKLANKDATMADVVKVDLI